MLPFIKNHYFIKKLFILFVYMMLLIILQITFLWYFPYRRSSMPHQKCIFYRQATKTKIEFVLKGETSLLLMGLMFFIITYSRKSQRIVIAYVSYWYEKASAPRVNDMRNSVWITPWYVIWTQKRYMLMFNAHNET